MTIKLYKNSAPPNKVDKSANLTKKKTIENVKFKREDYLSVLNPVILLQLTSDVGDIAQYNYVEIAKFNRFYYIDSIETEGGLIKISCRCDVLMSHKRDILNSKQYILRQETKNNSPYLDDNMLPIRSDHGYLMKPFGNYVDDRSCGRIILATTGKGGTPV